MPKTKNIDPAKIQMSSGNPREVFHVGDLAKLRESIDEVGILVPLTVYEVGGQIRLIDGERRLRCALELGLKEVPCFIVEGVDETVELEWMFSIHMMREQWEEGPTAKALGALAGRMGGWDSEKLSAVTGLSNQRLKFYKALAESPPEILDRVIKGELPANLVADSVLRVANPLRTELPDLAAGLSDADIISSMVDKRDAGSLPDVVSLRDFRTMIRVASEDAEDTPETEELKATIKRVLEDPASPIDEAYEDTIGTRIAAETFQKTIQRFTKSCAHVAYEIGADAEAVASLKADLGELIAFLTTLTEELESRT